jgi:Kef-type K+ transport system membrane component KefB
MTNAIVHGAFSGLPGGNDNAVLVWHIFGSLALGVLVGAGLALYTQRVRKRVALMVFGMLFVVAEGGNALHLDPLLVGIAAGLFVENVSPVSGHEVIRAIEPATMPTFALFFSVIGCEVQVHAFFKVAPVAVGLAVVRAIGIIGGSRLGAPLSGLEKRLRGLVPHGLIPQAGVAIALANLVRSSFHPWGEGLSTVILGVVLCNQVVGPILFRIALGRAGEVRENRAPSDSGLPPPPVAVGGVARELR